MRRVFRVVGVLLLSLLALSFFSCGKKASSKVTVEIWEQHDAAMGKVFDQLSAKFMTNNPGIIIKRVHYATEDLRSQFQTAVLSGQGPDLVFGPNDNIGIFSTGQLIIPLDDFLGASFFSRFPENVTASAQIKGKTWGVPILMGNTLSFLYNKKYFKKVPATFDDLIAAKSSLPEGTYALAYNESEAFWVVSFLGAFGGKVFDSDGNITLNTPEMIKTLAFVHDLKFKDGLMPEQSDYNVADTLFKEGKTASLINGPWSWASYREIKDLDFDIVPIPEIKGVGRPLPYSASKTVSVSANLDLKDKAKVVAVKKFLEFLTSVEFQVPYAVISSESPAVKTAITDPKIQADPSIKAVVNQVKYSIPMPIRPEMRAIWDAMGPELKEVMANRKTPEEAAKTMQEQAEKKAKSLRAE